MGLTANIIGTGRLGKTIGRLLVKKRIATINGIYNRDISNSNRAIDFIGEGEAYPSIPSLPHADLIFITTPDAAIAETCLTLAENPNIKTWSIIVHCSGTLNSDILSPMKQKGRFTGSVHPMHSFANPEFSVENFTNTYCAIEGDAEATKIITRVFDSMGAITFSINKDKKAIYHAAGVFASNYLVTLYQQAMSCIKDAGVEEKTGAQAMLRIMKGTLSNLERTMSAQNSLTGPIQRGDAETIINHLNALKNPMQKELYALLGNATLGLTQHSAIQKEVLNNALRETSYQ